jgi:hypothetical protein
MPLKDRELADWCDRPAQECANHPSCAQCPYELKALNLKGETLEAEKKKKEGE